ncbi:MAG TPA: UvrD-helicase domain-containing protein, partial [Acidimicrobiales bacterium]
MSAESPALVDHDARARIADTASADTLFVVAGAGTGKTSALVDRLVRLVLVEGVPLAEIAAITFTHAAATELADRVREALERAAAEPGGGERADRARLALADADGAAITTLHSFAQRLLAEHPIEAGLPPRVEVLDEVSSEIEFAARWADFVEGLLTDPSFERPLTWATQLGLQVTKRASGEPLRDVAALFDDQWDRLLVVARQPDPDLTIDTAPLRLALDALVALPAHHHGPPDGLSGHLATIMPWVRQVLAALDGPADHLVTLLARSPRLANKDGGKNNWPDVDAARACTVAADVACDAAIESAKHAVLRWITIRIARFTIERAAERRREGRLEFHDLLVLARQLLRLRPDARAALRRRYTRLLVDEFQDTDPIQIELAVLLATTVADLAGHEAWNELPVDHERLFFVGDPTQSIYRFRRADIALFLAARDAFGKPPVQLTQNFRTVATIVGWVNEVFGELMRHEEPGKQPAYQRLHPMRTDGDGDHRVRLLGGPRTGKAGELRTEEAEAVARIIDDIRANPAAWLVSDRDCGGWREPALQDITILLPTRTSLGALQAALDARHIPHRADTGSLVYNSQEVRDLLAVLRAVADPFNGVALVAALRSPLFGCGDDDLVRYH